jgi:hypothetical protein
MDTWAIYKFSFGLLVCSYIPGGQNKQVEGFVFVLWTNSIPNPSFVPLPLPRTICWLLSNHSIIYRGVSFLLYRFQEGENSGESRVTVSGFCTLREGILYASWLQTNKTNTHSQFYLGGQRQSHAWKMGKGIRRAELNANSLRHIWAELSACLFTHTHTRAHTNTHTQFKGIDLVVEKSFWVLRKRSQ